MSLWMLPKEEGNQQDYLVIIAGLTTFTHRCNSGINIKVDKQLLSDYI